MSSDFNTYQIKDLIPSKDGELVILRTVDIIKQEPLEKGATYFVRFEKVEPEDVPEFNR